MGTKVMVKWDAKLHGKTVKKWYSGTVVKSIPAVGETGSQVSIDYDDGHLVNHPTAGLVVRTIGHAVPQSEYEAALKRKKEGSIQQMDEVTLSKAHSLGVV